MDLGSLIPFGDSGTIERTCCQRCNLEAVGVDLFEIIEAIRIRPTHTNIREPGFGVGGYCLTKDPLLAGIAARELFQNEDLAFPFSELAVETNREMPLAAIRRLEEILGSLEGRRILLLGISYRPDVGDTRHSPAERFVQEARTRGAQVVARDPLVTHWRELDLEIPMELPSAHSIDAAVFAVRHGAYRELDLGAWLDGASPAILDASAVLTRSQRQTIKEAGCVFAAIGEG